MKKAITLGLIMVIISIMVGIIAGGIYSSNELDKVKDQKISMELAKRQLTIDYQYVNVRREDSLSRASYYDKGIIGNLINGDVVYPTGKISYKPDYKGNTSLDWWIEIKWGKYGKAWVNANAIDEEVNPFSSDFKLVQPDLSQKAKVIISAVAITFLIQVLIVVDFIVLFAYRYKV